MLGTPLAGLRMVNNFFNGFVIIRACIVGTEFTFIVYLYCNSASLIYVVVCLMDNPSKKKKNDVLKLLIANVWVFVWGISWYAQGVIVEVQIYRVFKVVVN